MESRKTHDPSVRFADTSPTSLGRKAYVSLRRRSSSAALGSASPKSPVLTAPSGV